METVPLPNVTPFPPTRSGPLQVQREPAPLKFMVAIDPVDCATFAPAVLIEPPFVMLTVPLLPADPAMVSSPLTLSDEPVALISSSPRDAEPAAITASAAVIVLAESIVMVALPSDAT